MRKVAILVDGEWLRVSMRHAWDEHQATVTCGDMYKTAVSALERDETLFRLFYYDARPFDGTRKNPISNEPIVFKTQPQFYARERFYSEINRLPKVALRLGHVNMKGWLLKDRVTKRVMKGENPASISSSDIRPGFEQKGVDMRIGIDVATLSMKRIVDTIIMFCGDSDIVPALKLARREGATVVSAQLNNSHNLTDKIVFDSDEIRYVDVVPQST